MNWNVHADDLERRFGEETRQTPEVHPKEAMRRIEEETGQTPTVLGNTIWVPDQVDPIKLQRIRRRVSPSEVVRHNGTTEFRL